MRFAWFQFLFVLVFPVVLVGQPDLRKINHSAFQKGEVLNYNLSYGFFDVANASLSITKENKSFNNRSTHHVVGIGKTVGSWNWFFKVDDRYESYIDEEAILPWFFVRRVHEGGYKLSRDVVFDQYNNVAKLDKKEYNLDLNTHDLLSALYYARTLDLQNLKVGEVVTIPTFFDKEMYPLKIKYLGTDEVKTKVGKVNCLKFRPLLQEGRVFKEEEDMTIWISNDENKVPIRLKTNLIVGSLKMDLVNHKNLVSPLNTK